MGDDIALRSQARTLVNARAVIDAGKGLFCFSRDVGRSGEVPRVVGKVWGWKSFRFCEKVFKQR